MRSPQFYQGLLDGVSRSFAMCIPQLERPFRDQVGLAYLLLRVLDTVEDTSFDDVHVQQQQFEHLRAFLVTMPHRHEVDAFVARFPARLSSQESELLEHTFALLEDGHGLSTHVRTTIFRATDRMARGMAAYTRRPSGLRLLDVEDVARYCCFVAGVVGEMLTQLWAFGNTTPPPPTRLAYHFGLFLQKVNILKDQHEDEAALRFLVPDRDELLASLRDNARGALEYLQALPWHDLGYRTFCAWSLMMGAVTVAQLGEPKRSRRTETADLLARTSEVVQDNAALARQFDELMPPLPQIALRVPVTKPESLAWFRATLGAPFDDAELAQLGVRRP
jgi:phytoene/squalene synthetase